MAEDKKLQKKLAKFEEEIMNLARTECSTIEAETQSNLESQRASLKAAADAEAAKYFEAELRKIRGQFRAAAFSEKDRLRKELFSIREKYMSNVFDLAADRLREFAAGSEYADFSVPRPEKPLCRLTLPAAPSICARRISPMPMR